MSITSGATSGPFAVGIDPTALAFDGTNVWVADSGSNDVRKIDPASGARLDMTTVGTAPSAYASTVRACRVTNSGTNNVTKVDVTTDRRNRPLHRRDGAVRDRVDGSSIWSRTPAPTTSPSSTVPAPFCGRRNRTPPAGITFDGLNVWVANSTTNNVTKVTATRIAGGGLNARQVATLHWYTTNTTFKSYPTGQGPEAVAFDGTNVWIANSGSNTITKQSVATGRDPANGPGR